MSRRAVLVATQLALLVPASSWAAFHVARVNEVMSGVGGNANVQYVEIRILDPTLPQNAVAGSRLTWFDCNFTACQVLMQVPSNVANTGAGVTWLMASPSDATFFAATGTHAEFYWDNATIGNIAPACGMVCWGGPGAGVPPNPLTWDPGEPNNYTDCVAYGGYTGRTKTVATYPGGPTSGPPNTNPAGNGTTMSLTRVSDTNNNLNDFSLAAMTPTNNGAGNIPTQAPNPCTQAANNCPCTPVILQNKVETSIFLVKNPSDPPARKAMWLVKETAPNDDLVNGNPVTNGASLNLKLDAATQCFPMPSSGWSNVDGIGFKYADPTGANGAVKKAQIKRTPSGVFQIKVILSGKIAALNIVPPNPGTQGDMNFHINLGDQYCGSTAGGTLNPNDAVTFKAKGAPAPASCNVSACP